MTSRICWTALALTVSILPAAAAEPPELTPHRAVYDLNLAGNRGGMNETSAGMSGRMVFEFTGSACEGYTVNFRFVVEATDVDLRRTMTDLRTSSFEHGDNFDFLAQTFTNQVMTDEVKGSARREADRLTVDLLKPESRAVSFDAVAIFPTEHLDKILDAAEAGDTIVEQMVFDGSEKGDKLFSTTAIIGTPRTRPPAPTEQEIGDFRRWPVSIAYFDETAGGDRVPDYSISFDLWENGVTTNLTMDYGDFALEGSLVDYEALPVSDCPTGG